MGRGMASDISGRAIEFFDCSWGAAPRRFWMVCED